MKAIEIRHPANETWIEVYRGSCENTIQAFLTRYVLEMGLAARIVELS